MDISAEEEETVKREESWVSDLGTGGLMLSLPTCFLFLFHGK